MHDCLHKRFLSALKNFLAFNVYINLNVGLPTIFPCSIWCTMHFARCICTIMWYIYNMLVYIHVCMMVTCVYPFMYIRCIATSYGPSSVQVRFGFSILEPNRTELNLNHIRKNRTKPLLRIFEPNRTVTRRLGTEPNRFGKDKNWTKPNYQSVQFGSNHQPKIELN